MVKFLLLFSLLVTLSFADGNPLTSKIQSFLSEQTYSKNAEFINLIFEPKSTFYKNGRVDAVKVIQTLKEKTNKQDVLVILGSHYFGKALNKIFKNCFEI